MAVNSVAYSIVRGNALLGSTPLYDKLGGFLSLLSLAISRRVTTLVSKPAIVA